MVNWRLIKYEIRLPRPGGEQIINSNDQIYKTVKKRQSKQRIKKCLDALIFGLQLESEIVFVIYIFVI